MDKTIVYKVKNLKTGRFLTKSCCWHKSGATWDSIGKIKATLGNMGYWSGWNSETNFDEDVKIIEIEVVHHEGNTSNLSELVERERRYRALGKEYGSNFQTLVERIEAQGQNEQFQWVLVAKSTYDYDNDCHVGPFAEMLEAIKELKLKQNKDFKKASSYYSGGCVAFSSKSTAMAVRLRMSGQCTSIDIKKYVETNLDEDDDPNV
jgi:hypothetical protein